jgi:hypothetical protein
VLYFLGFLGFSASFLGGLAPFFGMGMQPQPQSLGFFSAIFLTSFQLEVTFLGLAGQAATEPSPIGRTFQQFSKYLNN